MAGCLGCRERGNVSPENVKRWTTDLSELLISSTARDRFKSYLKDREIKEGRSLMEFWEMCAKFLDKFKLDASCTKIGAADGGNQSAKLVLEEAEQIAQFAEDNIDFDAQMISLKVALHSGNTEKIKIGISEAKQSAAEMLEDKGYYKAFCQYLLLGN